jgi:hypothetical protein
MNVLLGFVGKCARFLNALVLVWIPAYAGMTAFVGFTALKAVFLNALVLVWIPAFLRAPASERYAGMTLKRDRRVL